MQKQHSFVWAVIIFLATTITIYAGDYKTFLINKVAPLARNQGIEKSYGNLGSIFEHTDDQGNRYMLGVCHEGASIFFQEKNTKNVLSITLSAKELKQINV